MNGTIAADHRRVRFVGALRPAGLPLILPAGLAACIGIAAGAPRAVAQTDVSPGTILTVTSTSGLPDSDLVTVESSGTLRMDGSQGAFTIPNDLSLSGSGVGDIGALYATSAPSSVTADGHIEIAGDVSINSDGNLILGPTIHATGGTDGLATLTFGGSGTTTILSNNPNTSNAIAGALQLVKQGSGTLVIQGTSGYTGGTLLTSGTVTVMSGGNLADGDLQITGGVLDLEGATQGLNSLTGSSAAQIKLNGSARLLLDSGNFGGTITGSGFVQLGFPIDSSSFGGDLTLSGNNSYTGGTDIVGGVLTITRDAALGDPSGRLLLGPAMLVLGGNIASSRAIEVNSLAFPAANSVIETTSGTTSILSGPMSITGGLTIEVDGDSSLTLSGTISGRGSLNVPFNGNLVLSGQNTYSGGTGVDGTLAITSDAALGAPTAPLALGPFSTLSLQGDVVSSRPIQINPNGDSGHAAGFVTVKWSSGTSSVLAGPISGTVGFYDFIGAPDGVLTLAGNNSFGGLLSFESGTLVIANPNAFGQVNFSNGGTGVVETDGINRVIGLPVSGYLQTGGTLRLRLYGVGENDHVVAGHVLLGGTLELVPVAGFVPGRLGRYVLITSDEPIIGEFSTIIAPPALAATIDYGANTVTVGQQSLALFATNPNQASIAAAFDQGISIGAGGDFGTLLGAFDALPSNAAIAASLDQLSPQRFQLFRNIAFDQSTFLATSLGGWLSADRDGAGPVDLSGLNIQHHAESVLGMEVRRSVAGLSPVALALGGEGSSAPMPSSRAGTIAGFISGTVATADVDASGGIAKSDFTSSGLVAGVAWRPDENWSLGALFAYGHADATLDGEGSKGKVDSYAPGLFAAYRAGPFRANALFAYQVEDYSTDRRILIGPLDRRAHGSTGGDAPMGAIGLGYDWFADDGVAFGPTLNAVYTGLSIDPFTESGAGAANLAIGTQSADSFRTRLGGHVRFTTAIGSLVLHPDIDLAWQHEFSADGTRLGAHFLGFAGGDFQVAEATLGGDSLFGGFTLTGSVSDTAAIFLGYHIQAGNRETAHNVVAGVKIEF